MSACIQLDEGCTAERLTMLFEHFCSCCDVKYVSHFPLLRLLFHEFGMVRGDVNRIRIFICIYCFSFFFVVVVEVISPEDEGRIIVLQ